MQNTELVSIVYGVITYAKRCQGGCFPRQKAAEMSLTTLKLELRVKRTCLPWVMSH
jgi:hypothetical protein